MLSSESIAHPIGTCPCGISGRISVWCLHDMSYLAPPGVVPLGLELAVQPRAPVVVSRVERRERSCHNLAALGHKPLVNGGCCSSCAPPLTGEIVRFEYYYGKRQNILHD